MKRQLIAIDRTKSTPESFKTDVERLKRVTQELKTLKSTLKSRAIDEHGRVASQDRLVTASQMLMDLQRRAFVHIRDAPDSAIERLYHLRNVLKCDHDTYGSTINVIPKSLQDVHKIMYHSYHSLDLIFRVSGQEVSADLCDSEELLEFYREMHEEDLSRQIARALDHVLDRLMRDCGMHPEQLYGPRIHGMMVVNDSVYYAPY